jgi:hypothetical protein
MDLNEMKNLIGEDGGKLVIVENGEPVLIVTSYADYQKNKKGGAPKAAPKVEKPMPAELLNEELKIEDLPL